MMEGTEEQEMDNSQPLTPVRRLMQYAYCRRLAYLEWVQQEWDDNYYTEDGRFVHRRVDVEKESHDQQPTTSVYLTAPMEALATKLDLLELDNGEAIPVEYKRGKPHNNEPALTEKVQLCAQALILRENGWACRKGYIYYDRLRRRLEVPIDDDLVDLTRTLHREMRDSFRLEAIPRPLVNDSRCGGCSLNGICLPEEVNYLNRRAVVVRSLRAPLEERYPLHLTEPGSKVGVSGEELVVRCRSEEIGRARLCETSEIILHGNCQISSQALRVCAREEIGVSFYSFGNWFVANLQGLSSKNVELRRAQYQTAFDPQRSLQVAQSIVAAKIHNQTVFLRRNLPSLDGSLVKELQRLKLKAIKAKGRESLLGLEGLAAKIYFGSLGKAFTGRSDFNNRRRRPPTDPVNAVLSFCYAMLARECGVVLHKVGFDPFQGFYHQPRYGRQSLALDLMEEFRTLLADSVTLRLFNTKQLKDDDFLRMGIGLRLKQAAKKRVVASFEARMTSQLTHPHFGYKVSYRRCLQLQARLLGRFLLGEIPSYPGLVTR